MGKKETVSTQEAPKQGFPILLTIVLSVVVFTGAAMVLRGRGGGQAIPDVTTSNQYNELLDDIEKKTASILEKADNEVPLTEQELKVLESVENDTIGLVRFDPSRFAIYLLLAKIAYAEGKYESAIENCTRFYERGPSEGSDEVLVAVAETRYVCSRANYRLSKWSEAIAEGKEAVKVWPFDGRYHWAYASALAEAGREEEALKAINQGLVAADANPKLVALGEFLTKVEERKKQDEEEHERQEQERAKAVKTPSL